MHTYKSICLKIAELSSRKGNFKNMVHSYISTSCLQSVSRLNVPHYLTPASIWFIHEYPHHVSRNHLALPKLNSRRKKVPHLFMHKDSYHIFTIFLNPISEQLTLTEWSMPNIILSTFKKNTLREKWFFKMWPCIN